MFIFFYKKDNILYYREFNLNIQDIGIKYIGII